MRFRYTLILALILAGLVAYIYFVESPRIAEENKVDKVLAVETDDITGITLVYADREIALEKGASGWRVTKPLEAPADEITVQNLVRAIADAEAKRTIDDPPADLAPFGLAQPFVTVRLTAGDEQLPELKVGNTTSVSYSTYVQRSDEPKIYLTSSAFRSGMDKQVKDLRDKKILELQEDAVNRIALRGPDGEVVLAKADGAWRIEQPESLPADAAAVRTLLSSVRNLRATDFASDAPDEADLASYGLAPPERQLVLTTDSGEVQLLVGKETEQGLYVKTGDRPTAFVVGKWVAKDLAKGVADLRDKTVLAFDPKTATSVEVARADGGTFTLRSKNGTWSLDGSDQPIDAHAASAFVGALGKLNGTQVIGDDVALDAYGLDPPALTITVKGENDMLIGTVLAGSHTPSPPTTEYAVKRADRPTVFAIRDFQFKQLDKKPADFVAEPPPPAGGAEADSADTDPA